MAYPRYFDPTRPSDEHRSFARQLRRQATPAERALWRLLRDRLPVPDTHFRRQVALGPYVADFCCLSHRLVIELDGSSHTEPGAEGRDQARTQVLAAQGFRILRFWNAEIIDNPDCVLETIRLALADSSPPVEPALA